MQIDKTQQNQVLQQPGTEQKTASSHAAHSSELPGYEPAATVQLAHTFVQHMSTRTSYRTHKNIRPCNFVCSNKTMRCNRPPVTTKAPLGPPLPLSGVPVTAEHPLQHTAVQGLTQATAMPKCLTDLKAEFHLYIMAATASLTTKLPCSRLPLPCTHTQAQHVSHTPCFADHFHWDCTGKHLS